MNDSHASRRWWSALAAVFVVALGIRLAAASLFVGLDATPSASANPDQLDYEAFAWQLAQGRGYVLDDGTPTARRPPGTSAAIAPVYALFGRSWTAARIWMALLSAATCIMCGMLAATIFDRRIGLIAAIGLALYPGHFYYAMHMLSETPYALGLTLATLATLQSLRRTSTAWALAAGVLWAATLLVRPQVLLLPLAVAPLLLMFRQHMPWRPVLVACVACAATLSPWVIRNAVVMERAALSTGFGHVMWGAHNTTTFYDPAMRGRWVATSILLKDAPMHATGESTLDQHTMRQAFVQIREHWRAMPGLLAMKLVRLIEPVHDTPNVRTRLAFTVGWSTTALLVIPGLMLAWRRSDRVRRESAVLLLPILATVMMTLLTYGLDRFRDACAPLFIPFAALAVAAVYDSVKARLHAGRTLQPCLKA
jgi:4-amino-4-deoxy-L-arabinose transferase-like glycosyltransferase